MLSQLSGVIIHLIQTAGYLGVALLMTLEACLIPIPSEITLPFAGFLAQKGTFILPLVIAAGAFGDILGTMLLYALGYYVEETIILKYLDKYGKFLLISRHEYNTVMNWFSKKGTIIIFIAKLLPGFRTIIGLPAGLSEVPFGKALALTTIGSIIWCGTFTYIGFALGSKWNSLEPIFRKFELAIGVVAVLGILWYINHKLKIVKLGK
ncbi:MAG TPA: DedA family protein [Patescibacteria group bacterium]|nr:DedA family protein [Patescibacteria group bacterium]